MNMMSELSWLGGFITGFQLVAAFRILLACLLGGVLGLERVRRLRAAGLRTYMLVAVGATMAVIVGEYLHNMYGADASRIAAQVVSGIGFLGAGTIIISKYRQVIGLTTAAGLWVSGCVGIAVGAGLYFAAIVMVIVSLTAITLGRKFKSFWIYGGKRIGMYVLFDTPESAVNFLKYLNESGIHISDLEISASAGTTVMVMLITELVAKQCHEEFVESLRERDGVIIAREI